MLNKKVMKLFHIKTRYPTGKAGVLGLMLKYGVQATASAATSYSKFFSHSHTMPDFQHAADDKKCLYRYDYGVIQLNVERLGQNSSSKAPWAVLTTESTDSGENAQQHPTLIRSQITCALHPTLSGNYGLPWTLNRLRME